MEGEQGTARAVPAADLSRLFSLLRDDIRRVVLNAYYSEPQAQEIAEHVGVVGMTNAVADQSAIRFATAFYRALGYGRDVQTAFGIGTNRIGLEGLGEEDNPQLLARRVAPSEVFVVSAG